MKKTLLALALLLALSPRVSAQPATHDQNNPRWKTVTADTLFGTRGWKLPGGWYIDSASIFGLLNGQVLVADTSLGRKRLKPGGVGAGSLVFVRDTSTYNGITQVNLDSFFVALQTIAGQITLGPPQPLGPWSSPEFAGIYVQPNGGLNFRSPDGLQTGTLYLPFGIPPGVSWKLGTAGGTIVSSAVSPLAISPSGQLGFSGVWGIAQGGTNATVAPGAGTIIYSNGSSYLGVAGTSGYFLRSGGAGTPTFYNLLGGSNTWGGKQTITNALQVDTLFVGTKDSTLYHRGDGKMIRKYTGFATFPANDTITVALTGVTTDYTGWAFFRTDPGFSATFVVNCTSGVVTITSRTSPLEGYQVQFGVEPKNR